MNKLYLHSPHTHSTHAQEQRYLEFAIAFIYIYIYMLKLIIMLYLRTWFTVSYLHNFLTSVTELLNKACIPTLHKAVTMCHTRESREIS
jgi:hypothetical protein